MKLCYSFGRHSESLKVIAVCDQDEDQKERSALDFVLINQVLRAGRRSNFSTSIRSQRK